MLNWAIKMKSKEADYTINYSIDYTNGREKPDRGCHKPALKCSYSFYFSVKNRRWHNITQNCVYAYNLLNVTGIYLSESCKMSNSLIADSNNCNSLIYLDNKASSFTLLKCLYAFTCHRQKIVADSSFNNPPINKTKWLNFHHKDNSSFRYANKIVFSMINNTEWTLNE